VKIIIINEIVNKLNLKFYKGIREERRRRKWLRGEKRREMSFGTKGVEDRIEFRRR
jgi:hypothetical protein